MHYKATEAKGMEMKMTRLIALLIVAPMLLLDSAVIAKPAKPPKVEICDVKVKRSGTIKIKIKRVPEKKVDKYLAKRPDAYVVKDETCNGVDDNCDGTVDDGDVCDPCGGKTAGRTCDAGMDGPVLTCEGGVCDTCVPAGTCSVTMATTCAFDEHCPGVETCVLGPDPSPRYVDNGDGTVTDRRTCLVWEQKTGTYDRSFIDCSTTTCSDPHEVDNLYEWCLDAEDDFSCDNPGNPPDGGAFTDLLDKLNTASFAGHSDWRLPKSGGRPDLSLASGEPAELESILTCSPPYTFPNLSCVGTPPFVDSIFNTAPYATAPNGYWSATTYAPIGPGTMGAWLVYFGDGNVFHFFKASRTYVRAVRGGS
jgi:hypothetical protein